MSCLRIGARAALLLLVPALLASQRPETGVVAGRIMLRADSGDAVAARGARITLASSALEATTDADGRFTLPQVWPGSRVLQVRFAGFRTVTRTVEVRAGDTSRVDITLTSEAQRLAAMRADARGADAELFLSKPGIATVVMSAAAMAGVPSVGERDVVRVVQLLPGVVSRNDYNTGLNVRGGEADQNLIVLDGFPIYNPFHLGGLFSTFMDATVGGIELSTGAFPSRWGGRLSSVLDVRSQDDVRPGLHVNVDVSALATSARLAGTFASGRGSWSFAGRRTYADALASAFTDNIFPYHFTDFHGRARWELSNGVRVSMTAYGGRDILDANLAEFERDSSLSNAGEGQWAFDWGNRVLGVSIAKDVGENTTFEQRISTSGFSTVLDLGNGALEQRSSIRDVRLAGSLQVRGQSHDRSIGYELATHRIRYASGAPQTTATDFDLAQSPRSAAVWVEDLWRLSPAWLLEGGLRAEALSGRNWAALSPRLAVKYFVSSAVALTAAASRVTQWQHSLAGDGPLRYFDIWVASDSFIPVATAWHGIVGGERRFAGGGSVKVEGYVKRYDRVLDVNRYENPAVRGDEFYAAEGLAYGADVLARWQSATGISGWVSYSYGMSTRTRDGIRWAPGHDRRHDLDIVLTRRLGDYRLGSRFGLASGTPYTPIVGGIARRVYDPSRDRWGTGDPTTDIDAIGGTRNSERFPANHRLDLDLSRDFNLRGATVSPYLSVANVYNAQNVFVYLYRYGTDQPTRRAISQFPILPSAGARVAF